MALDLDAFNDIVLEEEEENIIERLRFDDSLEIPHQLTDVDLWLNYCNDDLYHMDKEIRAYIKKTRWHRVKRGSFKTAAPLIFIHLFGRKATPADSHTCRMIHKLLDYYCTKYTGTSMINGIRFSRVYYFSKYACTGKRPLSIRLRLEEADGEFKGSFREYKLSKSKRAKPRPGVTAHGPFANGGGGVPE